MGEGKVIRTVEEDTVIVSLHHAVIMNQISKVALGGHIDCSALLRTEGLRVVAAVDGGVGTAPKCLA